MIGDQSLAQRTDDRNTAPHAGFVIEIRPARLGRREDLVAMLREERLVRRHHRLALLQRLEDQVLGDGRTPDQFHHHVYLGILNHGEGVRGQEGAVNLHATVPLEVEIGDLAQHDL
jgi:hypothetical protein